jgi:hypothetical protein
MMAAVQDWVAGASEARVEEAVVGEVPEDRVVAPQETVRVPVAAIRSRTSKESPAKS